MVTDHINYLTFEDPGAVHTVRRALKLAEAGDLYGAAETAGVDVAHAAVVSQGLRRGMRFAIGAEVDNDPRARPDAQNIVDAMRPDGIIRSVNFLTIEHPEKGPDFQWAFQSPEFRDLYESVGTERLWELYMAKLLDDIEKLPGQIAGHFYSPALYGHWPSPAKLEQYEDQLLDACAARAMAVEINTRPLYRDYSSELKELYRAALVRLMRKAKAKDVGIAIGSGAHSPKDQGGAFAEVLRMLDEAGINEIVFPVNGRLARVALRATKEHLQKVQAKEPAPQPGSSISGFSRAELGLPEREEGEERELAAAAKTGHDAGPRKRASSPDRASKKPVKDGSEREVKAAKTAAKAAKAAKPAKTEAAAESKTKIKEPKTATKPATVKTKAPAAKNAEAKKPAVKAAAKPPAKAAAKPPTKAAAKTVKAAPKKVSAAKPAPAKTAAKKPAVKVAAKKATPAKKAAPVKKAAPKKAAPAKKAPVKKSSAVAKRKVSTAKRPATKKTSSKRR